jgi:hypothetical protein
VIDSLLIVRPGLIWGASLMAEGLEVVSPSVVVFRRIAASVNDSICAKLRTLKPRP